ncbi:HAMP domain-containing sensor histidine kinase [Paenibacillus radicis (ex Gao et al. 2016)]|uniref:Heme sensor protein HssS n=1 Tax=Paenibacillus radicis (ex Gao et al. 2016) TaxID=1737354 RepID=A0A917M6W9_9BACL|nr:sensor histidine kinase [Paenibacillus radicis (ex Gao et al. 2016)]GGG78873.1 two-component sensor histidine kinase [Paenibacillus radicis (ex Gao et al. 2016)]
MIKTLYVRIVVTFLAVILFSLLTSFLAGMFLFQKEINHAGQNDMLAAGREMIELYEQTKPADRGRYLARMAKVSTYRIHLYDTSSKVTIYGPSHSENAVITPEAIQQVLLGKAYRSPVEQGLTFVGLPFPFDGEQHAMFMQFTSQNENVFNRMLLLILLLGLLIGSLCIIVAARYLVKPLQTLTQATKRLAKGDFDIEIKTKRADEVGVLTQGFNEMASELKQLEQMRQDFVSNVSHEIQTPLTSITGFAMAMKNSSLVAESDRNYYLDIIISESGRLSRLSDNLLKLASLDSEHHPFEAVPYNLVEQIKQVVVTCEPQWSAKGIRIDLDTADSVKITADRDQLNQVWMNLLGNSIKFTPEGGHIDIGIKRFDNEILFSITDTGIGVPPEQLEMVFERFYKTDPARNRSVGGNGLGLAIAKKIIALHDGSIEMKSRVGEGTTVKVRLPVR